MARRIWVYFFAFLFLIIFLGGFVLDSVISAGLVTVVVSSVFLSSMIAYFRE